jgi:hypothetical protein
VRDFQTGPIYIILIRQKRKKKRKEKKLGYIYIYIYIATLIQKKLMEAKDIIIYIVFHCITVQPIEYVLYSGYILYNIIYIIL